MNGNHFDPFSLWNVDDLSAPLSVDIVEFNNGPMDCEQFVDIIDAYCKTLLSTLSAFIHFEFLVKHAIIASNEPVGLMSDLSARESWGLQNMTNGRFAGGMPSELQTPLPTYRAGTLGRESGQPTITVELKMFTITVLHALKQRGARMHEVWMQFAVHILPYHDR
jgi:hypothetical protein